jgi:hypothetical protein
MSRELAPAEGAGLVENLGTDVLFRFPQTRIRHRSDLMMAYAADVHDVEGRREQLATSCCARLALSSALRTVT